MHHRRPRDVAPAYQLASPSGWAKSQPLTASKLSMLISLGHLYLCDGVCVTAPATPAVCSLPMLPDMSRTHSNAPHAILQWTKPEKTTLAGQGTQQAHQHVRWCTENSEARQSSDQPPKPWRDAGAPPGHSLKVQHRQLWQPRQRPQVHDADSLSSQEAGKLK